MTQIEEIAQDIEGLICDPFDCPKNGNVEDFDQCARTNILLEQLAGFVRYGFPNKQPRPHPDEDAILLIKKRPNLPENAHITLERVAVETSDGLVIVRLPYELTAEHGSGAVFCGTWPQVLERYDIA